MDPRHSGITTIHELWENPEVYDGKIVTTQGYSYDLSEKVSWEGWTRKTEYYLTLHEKIGFSLRFIHTDMLTDDQVNYIKSFSCTNSYPLFRVKRTVNVNYYTIGLTKNVDNINIEPISIEFVECIRP